MTRMLRRQNSPLRMPGTIGRRLAVLLDIVLPPRCALTGEIVPRNGTLSPEAWAGLSFIAAPLCDICGLPFGYDEDPDADGAQERICASCLDHPPAYDSARAALRYDSGSRDLILGFKHADQTHLTRLFTPWLAHAGAEMIAESDMLAPVPLHRWRLLKRRYNQAALLAYSLGRASGVAVIPDLLVRSRATKSQGKCNAGGRRRNVRGAFACPRPERVAGRRIVLVDDVFTTGATIEECAKVLKGAGAVSVDVLTIARVC